MKLSIINLTDLGNRLSRLALKLGISRA